MPKKDYAEIFEEVKALLQQFDKVPENIGEETELVNDLGLDSLLVMELVQEVEDAYDISFPLNDLSGIRTVRDFVLRIQQELEA
ncbi:acyl carrier protein [Geobacter benzoatilyticus]|jgi:acyl carrier protein|uniref:Acyl carrier protein n=1 Tax=Geobacter benzoatilyticus TaxID=2815309 RepID=A0ABX7Q7F0_9BACT|nr:acyl carrier protein [Geobacter benzoatilyticus]QSV46803.1 acyl carrier protein [Geobacter benzoatilyticus]